MTGVDVLLQLGETGVYELPPEVSVAANAYRLINARSEENARAATSVGTAIVSELADELVERATSTGKLPADLSTRIAKAEADDKRVQIEGRVLSFALEHAGNRLVASFGVAEEPLHQAFTNALEAVLDGAREVAQVLHGVNISRVVNVLGSPEHVQAFQRLEQLVARFASLRSAHRHLRALNGVPQRDDWLFAELRNAPAIWGESLNARWSTTERPWPTDGNEYLLWLVTANDPTPEPWFPTADAQDAVFEAWMEPRRPTVSARTIREYFTG